MSVTPNWSWPLIEPTDFVTNLPADLETLADAIDATVYTVDQESIKKTNIDAKGDLIVGTADNTITRLAVGSNGQVLTADSVAAAGVKWATVGSPSWTLLNSGSQSLSGSSTITISGLSAKAYHIVVGNASSANASSQIRIRFNTDTANHRYSAINYISESTYDPSNLSIITETNGGYAAFAKQNNNAIGNVSGYCRVENADSTGVKPFFSAMGGAGGGGSNGYNGHEMSVGGGVYVGGSAITSISIISSTGNFDNGEWRIYGAN